MIKIRASRVAMMCAIAALIAPIHAFGATRAPSSQVYSQTANAASQAVAQAKQNPGRSTAGPKSGFPQNHGLDVAKDRANENAPFKSNGV